MAAFFMPFSIFSINPKENIDNMDVLFIDPLFHFLFPSG